MSLDLHQTPVKSLVVEFANIIAPLYNSESNQSLILSFSSQCSTQINITMASIFHDLVFVFYEQDANDKSGQQDLAEFIETLTFAIERQVYTDKFRRQTATQVISHTRLRDKALLWY